MQIKDLTAADVHAVEQAAALLVLAFKEHSPEAWPTMESARAEVRESLGPGRISRVAFDAKVGVVGWVGGIRAYGGMTWELHPLVVHPQHQGQGIGRALVLDLEEQVLSRGGRSIYLGTDDEDGMTSVGQVELYPHVLEHLARIRNLKRHPYEFYQKMGFAVVGVIPDASGPGRPDIFMAKRIA
jgi:aminoglycoside 6'-N-acetyltransferase I